jgi:aminopeptidase N
MYRVLLPNKVEPQVYHLEFNVDIKDQFVFKGTEQVEVLVNEETDEIVMHAKDLYVTDFSVKFGATSVDATRISSQLDSGVLTIKFGQTIPCGPATFSCKFSGTLNDQLAGFYRSSVKDGKTVNFMGVTQMEPIDARRVFPCWDEPAQKAVFNVAMVLDSHLTALSNMPEKSSVFVGDTKKKVTFMETPKMSTYLLALCVGELEHKSAYTSDGTLIRAFSPPGKVDQTDFSLEVAVKIMEYYNQYFDLPYPMPKLDIAAIPDFAAGAMENWGFVTFREADMLCDSTASVSAKIRIATVVCHECAHQWFGNLVTMRWWDDLWLNEGFASYMETKAVDALFPHWDRWQAYVSGTQGHALRLDCLRNSHPIQVPIAEAKEVEEVFDAISYCKGGSVVQMCAAVMGEEKFRDGLRVYMKRHQYSNTETVDLWSAFDHVMGNDKVSKMMTYWTEKKGFPLVNIRKEAGKLLVSQSYYVGDGSVQDADKEMLWCVPLICRFDDTEKLFWLDTPSAEFEIPAHTHFKVNSMHRVPMRCAYIDCIDSVKAFTPEDKIGMISDIFTLGKSGHVDPVDGLRFIQKTFKDERGVGVWQALSPVLSGYHWGLEVLEQPQILTTFEEMVRNIVGPLLEDLKWEHQPGDSEEIKRLRQTLLLTYSGVFLETDPICKWANQRFNDFEANNSCLSGDLRTAVLKIFAKSNKDSCFQRLRKIYESSGDSLLRRDVYYASGFAANSVEVLTWSLTPAVKSQDLFLGLSGTDISKGSTVLDFFEEHYDAIIAQVGGASMMFVTSFVTFTGSQQYSPAVAERVQAFWKSKPIYNLCQKTVAQTVESIALNQKFLKNLEASKGLTSLDW